MAESQASRHFDALLDAVEHGETVVVTPLITTDAAAGFGELLESRPRS